MDPEREFAAGNLDGIQNHPSGAQRLSKSIRCAHFFAILKPTRFQKVARSARGFILYDLLCILGPTWSQFYRFWKQFWHRLLHNMLANRRKARNTMQRTCRTLAIAMGTKRWPQNPKRMQSTQAPRFGGGVRLPTFCPGGTFASFSLKLSPKLANIILYP